MAIKITTVIIVMCTVIIEINGESNIDSNCERNKHRLGEYTRVKRAKYYSGPPKRFYARPPVSYPTKGVFSYTPPPGYMIDDEEPQYLVNPRPSKVSKRPAHDGLKDEDINNIVKYLSKKDLNKIVEIAGEKEKMADKYNRDSPLETYNTKYNKPLNKREENINVYKANVQEIGVDQQFSLNGPYVNGKENRPLRIEYSNQNINYLNSFPQQDNANVEKFPGTSNQPNSNLPIDMEETIPINELSYLNTFVHQEINGMTSDNDRIINKYKIQDEELPKPLNLRDEPDFEISFTNSVPSVVKADSSYHVEGFGNLPLMNMHHSKLHSGSSYTVPHYTEIASNSDKERFTSMCKSVAASQLLIRLNCTLRLRVTSSGKQSSEPSSLSYSSASSSYDPSPSLKIPPLEPAPPATVAKQQSDAHLKAIKIWTHRSKGTAYTLHDDGTLSLEIPGRPKTKYGYS